MASVTKLFKSKKMATNIFLGKAPHNITTWIKDKMPTIGGKWTSDTGIIFDQFIDGPARIWKNNNTVDGVLRFNVPTNMWSWKNIYVSGTFNAKILKFDDVTFTWQAN